MDDENARAELVQLRKAQSKARQNEVYGGLTHAEQTEYKNRAKHSRTGNATSFKPWRQRRPRLNPPNDMQLRNLVPQPTRRNVRHRTEIRVVEVLASAETLRRGGSRIVKLPIPRSRQHTSLGAKPAPMDVSPLFNLHG
jgi:hypothetical protein